MRRNIAARYQQLIEVRADIGLLLCGVVQEALAEPAVVEQLFTAAVVIAGPDRLDKRRRYRHAMLILPRMSELMDEPRHDVRPVKTAWRHIHRGWRGASEAADGHDRIFHDHEPIEVDTPAKHLLGLRALEVCRKPAGLSFHDISRSAHRRGAKQGLELADLGSAEDEYVVVAEHPIGELVDLGQSRGGEGRHELRPCGA